MDSFDFVNDPIAAAQIEKLRSLLRDEWSDKARDGFLVIAGRFVDHMGDDRTGELRNLFKTDFAAGRVALRRSLETLFDFVGSLGQFEMDFPVLINDPVLGSRPVFPQLPILGIATISEHVYRVLHSSAKVHGTEEPVRDFVIREGRLPHIDPFVGLVLREKPRIHWCSYEQYPSPLETASALQILPSWNSDCKLRATISTQCLKDNVFVAFNGDKEYADGTSGKFAGYYFEIQAQDHPQLPGGGLQVGVVGSPEVDVLEEWDDVKGRWATIWARSNSKSSE